MPALVTLWPKERVFWEPFGAGPLELRLRRVAGIFVGFLEGLLGWVVRFGWLRSWEVGKVDDEGMEGRFAGQRGFAVFA